MRAQIKQVLADHAKLQRDIGTVGDGDDLFSAGMTSLNSINVMLAIEDQFDIEFPNDLLNRKTFQSVDSIASAVDALVASK